MWFLFIFGLTFVYFLCCLFFFFFLMYVCAFFCFFFFSSRRRHTRCGRDWSSDVCSSDLIMGLALALAPIISHFDGAGKHHKVSNIVQQSIYASMAGGALCFAVILCAPRSEERRVGKECRSRWSPCH